MNLRAFGILLSLAAVWGGSFLFIRLAVPTMGPIALIEARVLLAALTLAAYAWITHRPFVPGKAWQAYLLLGAMNAAIPFTLIAFAELHLTASLAAILNATTPLWTAIIAALWLREPFTRRKAGGLVLGLLGVGIAVGWSPLHLTPPLFLATGASLLAAICFGIGGIFSWRRFPDESPLVSAFGQQLSVALLWLLPSAIFHPVQLPNGPVIVSIIALAMLSTALGYLLYFYLITTIGPTNTLLVNFLVPIFGLLWGAAFLHEAVTYSIVIGLGVVLISVVLVTNVRFVRRRSPIRSQEASSEERIV
jgi:drug/metabolite transporter (DMT)-like permease